MFLISFYSLNVCIVHQCLNSAALQVWTCLV